VTCVLGDGSLRFGALGLWTIAAMKLPITLVILDNGGYGSTRFFEREYVARLGPEVNLRKPSYSNMDMRNLGPSVGCLIEGFGIPCRSLTPEDDVRAALMKAWSDRGRGPNAVVIPLGFEG
jgi:thiamine pyrophosphate-dependent acetolactate synthase large subunit-like protein